ncbi:MAG: SDR family oxidoreductase [Alphaproteobacteria bacterium]|nr:SDR family oxidoreductase [Alphaproteobacteria bacterium]
MQRLEDKIAIVFGAGSCGPGWGNGKAVAVAFARQGAKVLAVDLDAAAGAETRDIIRGEGGECDFAQADVADESQVRDAVAACLARWGRIDILHNNVGISAMGGPESIDTATWDHVLDANLKGMFLTCRHVLPQMVAQGSGAIVNVGSVSGMRYLGLPQIAYATSKGAIVTFTRAIAAEYGPKGVRANVLSPGIVDTPLLARGAAVTFRETFGAGDASAARKLRESTIPLRRFGDAWDVANAAVFLASEEARYITGTELVVDGGLTCQVQYPLR